MRRHSDASDALYFALFIVSAWLCCSCVYWGDWVDLLFISVPFVGWTLERGGLRVT